MRGAWAALLLLLGLPGLPLRFAGADEIVLRGGRSYVGYPRRQGAEIHLNEYGCSAPEMTLGVRRLRAIDVREIRPHPLADHLQRVLEELGPRDVRRRVDLLREAQSARERAWVERLAAEILAVDAKHAEALRAIGGAEKFAALRAGNPALDERLARDIRRFLRIESGADRKQVAARLAREHGYDPGPDVLERMVRSAQRDRGLREELRLRLDAAKHEGAHYSLYVPPAYDPVEPRPLLVALHGGGIMHEKGEVVRGSAKDALALYLDDAKRLGWFLLCPAAVEAPWTTSDNYRFLETVLAEVLTLFNVDTQRIHLAGQGGGGDGAWYWAARKGDRFASVSVASAGKPTGLTAVAGKTAVWLYHGDADEVVPIEPVRKAADGLLRRKADFVYCELPREAHGLAPAARRDMFRYVAPKRRRRARSAWPEGSFETPSSAAAVAAFGDPAAAWGLGLPDDADADALLALLAAGRTEAEHAARRLVDEFADRAAALAPKARAIVADREAGLGARVWAAWLLGRWRTPEAVNELGDTLRTARNPRLLRYCAEAVARIGSEDSAQDLRWAMADVSKRFRSLPGKTVPYQAWERACRLAASIAEAIGRCVKRPDAFFPEMEENLVRHLLMDRRRITFVARNGEDPSEPRVELAASIARAYRRLEAEKTLFDMLREAVKADKAATAAVLRAMRMQPR